MTRSILYIKQHYPCDRYNLTIGKQSSNGNLSAFVCFPNVTVLDSIVHDVQKTMGDYWQLTSPHPFVPGKRYWWITSPYSGWLRNVHCKSGVIPDNVVNQRFNYFENSSLADGLKSEIEKILQKYDRLLQNCIVSGRLL